MNSRVAEGDRRLTARTSASPYSFANALRPNLAKLAESDLHLVGRQAASERARFKICDFLSEGVEPGLADRFLSWINLEMRRVIARAH